MQQHRIIFLISLFSLVSDQECIFGINCPYNQGICVDMKCECIEGYWSLMDKSLPPEKQTFCNYKQTNLYLPLVLEFFLPGIGHIYIGKYWFATVKIILFITSVVTGYYLYGSIQIPNFILTLKNQIIPEEELFKRNSLKKILRGRNKDQSLEEEIRKQKKEEWTNKTVTEKIFNATFIPFWIFWVGDLYFYFFKVYKDANGVPLV